MRDPAVERGVNGERLAGWRDGRTPEPTDPVMKGCLCYRGTSLDARTPCGPRRATAVSCSPAGL